MEARRLVAYFSASGVTARKAAELAKLADAEIYGIQPKEPYKKADLNWMNPFARSTKEMKGKAPHPELKDKDANIQDYDTILLAFPIWWYIAPTIVNSFLEAYDFSGKTVILFATSGGSGLGNCAEELKKSLSAKTVIKNGFMLNGEISKEQLSKLI